MGKIVYYSWRLLKVEFGRMFNNMVILENQSTSKYDSMGDSVWLARQGKCASTTSITDVEWFFCKGKGILKIELRKVYGRKQNNWKSPAQKYMLDI